VGLVDDQQRAVLLREFPQGFVVTLVRQHDAHVGHGRFRQYAGNLFGGQSFLQAFEVVEFDRGRGHRGVHRRADVAGA